MGALGKVVIGGREAQLPLIVDHLEVAAEVAAVPHRVTRRALTHEPLDRIAVLVSLFFRVEYVDHVLMHHLRDLLGEGHELGLGVSELLQRVRGALLGLAVLLGAESPVLEIGDEGSAGVNDDGLELLHLRGVDVRQHFLVGAADDGRDTMARRYAGDTVVEVDQHRLRCADRQRGLANAGASVDDRAEGLL